MDSSNDKRKHTEENPNDNTKKIKTSELNVLKEMQQKLTNADSKINDEIELTKQKYFVSYFKKVLKELPVCNNIIDLESIQENKEGFYKTYSIAKTCVSSHLQLKKIMAFNSIFDMINGVISKYIHDKYISPNLKTFLSENSLNNVFAKYQEALVSEDNQNVTELHCISYLIQNEIEKNEPIKVPNPVFNRMTQQVTALSKYITELIKEISLNPLNSMKTCIVEENISEKTAEMI